MRADGLEPQSEIAIRVTRGIAELCAERESRIFAGVRAIVEGRALSGANVGDARCFVGRRARRAALRRAVGRATGLMHAVDRRGGLERLNAREEPVVFEEREIELREARSAARIARGLEREEAHATGAMRAACSARR